MEILLSIRDGGEKVPDLNGGVVGSSDEPRAVRVDRGAREGGVVIRQSEIIEFIRFSFFFDRC